jgi:hypothetical protein
MMWAALQVILRLPCFASSGGQSAHWPVSSTPGSAKTPGGRRHLFSRRNCRTCGEVKHSLGRILSLSNRQYPFAQRTEGSGSTYEGLKHAMLRALRSQSTLRSGSTYEGLKPAFAIIAAPSACCQFRLYL